MGITVHFEGRLLGEAAYLAVISMAEKFSSARGWRAEKFAVTSATLARVRDEQDWDYVGPTKGIELHSHPSCEPIRLEFDKDLYIQEYTKTQFAPIQVHIDLISLLKNISSHFSSLDVIDEGEYFETGREDFLNGHRERCNEILEEHLSNDPTLKGPVRLPSGRIADIIRDA